LKQRSRSARKVYLLLLAFPAVFPVFAAPPANGQSVDLLQRYPTKLIEGDTDHARPWDFSGADLFRLSTFSLAVGGELRVRTGPADLGIGHCEDGAV
jgi:hypothetical protein